MFSSTHLGVPKMPRRLLLAKEFVINGIGPGPTGLMKVGHAHFLHECRRQVHGKDKRRSDR
jgi:hypothetical protein